MSVPFAGQPLFDSAKYLEDLSDFHCHPSIPQFLASLPQPLSTLRDDYEISRQFLMKYADVPGTFSSFCGEIQRFSNYLWVTTKRTLSQVDADEVTAYFKTLKNPPHSWKALNVASGSPLRSSMTQRYFLWRGSDNSS